MPLIFKEDKDFSAHNRLANDVAARELKEMVAQIESALAAKADAAKDESDIYVVARSKGYNVRALKRLIKERRVDADRLRDDGEALEMYKTLIGMV